jgi:hypothetical protein
MVLLLLLLLDFDLLAADAEHGNENQEKEGANDAHDLKK